MTFLLPLLMRLRCYGNLKFSLIYNGKSENWPLLLCHCRYFDKGLKKCSCSNPLPNVSFLSKSLNLIGCHVNRKAKFEKQYSKIISSEAIRGIMLKFYRNVCCISLHKNGVLLPLLMRFHCYGKFPWTYNGESKNWSLLLCHCRYVYKSFTEMFVE